MAQQLGLAPETLRYYERLGLLPAPRRNGGHYRDYTDEDLERLRLLVGLRQIDISLPIAAKLATMCAAGRCDEVLGAAIPVERSKIRQRVCELRHVDARLALLERELRAGQRPRELIHLEMRRRTSDVRLPVRPMLRLLGLPLRLPVRRPPQGLTKTDRVCCLSGDPSPAQAAVAESV